MADVLLLVYAEVLEYEAGRDPEYVGASVAGDADSLKRLAQIHADPKTPHGIGAPRSNDPLTWSEDRRDDGKVIYSSSVIQDGYGNFLYYIEPVPLIDEPIDMNALADLREDILSTITEGAPR